MIKTSVAAAISLFALMSAQTASAVTLDTLCGPTICYEYDQDQVAVDIFGLPTLVGDALRFLPPSFRAQSDDGGLLNNGFTDTATGNFIFSDVYTVSGKDIYSITVYEAGDYEITNGDWVSADLYLLINNNNDVFDSTSSTVSFDAAGDSGGLQRWQLSNTIKPLEDPGDILPFPWSSSSSMTLNIQDTLQAYTDANGESAWIQKKVTLVVSEVPVPAAVWMFGSGLGLLGFLRRRKLSVQ
jgi:hypothetical protein